MSSTFLDKTGKAVEPSNAYPLDAGPYTSLPSRIATLSSMALLEDMMYYRTKFCSEAKPNCKPNSKSTLSKSQKNDMKCVCHEGTSILDCFSAIWCSFRFTIWIYSGWCPQPLRVSAGLDQHVLRLQRVFIFLEELSTWCTTEPNFVPKPNLTANLIICDPPLKDLQKPEM